MRGASAGVGYGRRVSPFWIWMQVLIVVFVLAGAIIALTRLL